MRRVLSCKAIPPPAYILLSAISFCFCNSTKNFSKAPPPTNKVARGAATTSNRNSVVSDTTKAGTPLAASIKPAENSSSLLSMFHSEVHTPIRLGVGYNTVTQHQTSEAIEFGSQKPSSGDAMGASTSYSSEIVKDFKDLVQKSRLTVDATMKLANGLSATGSTDLFRSFKFNSKSIFLFAECEVRTPSIEIANIKFTEAAKKEAEANITRFFINNGDEFVYKQNRGGSLKIIFEFNSSTATQEEENKVQLSAAQKFFAGGWKANAAFHSTLSKIESNQRVKLYFFRAGDYAPIPAVSFDSLEQYARNFPTTMTPDDKMDIVYSVETKSYKYAGNKPKNIHTLPPIVYKSRKLIEVLQEKMYSSLESLGNIKYIKENIADFDEKVARPLLNKEDDIKQQIKWLYDVYDKFATTLQTSENVASVEARRFDYVSIPVNKDGSLLKSFDFGNNALNNKIYLGNIIASKEVTGVLNGRLYFRQSPQADNLFYFPSALIYDELYNEAFGGYGMQPTHPRAPDLNPITVWLHDHETNEVKHTLKGQTGQFKVPKGIFKVYAMIDQFGRIYNGTALYHEKPFISVPPTEMITLSFE